MIIKLLAFITIFLFEQTLTQGCIPIISSNGSAPAIPDLESNIVNLAFTGNKQRENLYNVTLKNAYNKQTGYEIIAGIDFIQSYFDPAALDFSVRTIPQPTYFTLYIVISETSNWTKMHIHYLASAREQVRVGYFIPNSPALLDFSRTPVTAAAPQNGATTNTASTNVATGRLLNFTFPFGDIRKWNATSKYPVARAYMTGIKYQDRFIDVQIVSAIANTTNNIITVSVNISNQKYAIESLYIGYIIYAQVNTVLFINVIQSSIPNFFDKSLNNMVENQFIGVVKLNAKRLSTFFGAGGKRRLLAIADVFGAGAISYDKSELLNFIESFESEGLSIETVSTAEPSSGGLSAVRVGFPIIKEGTGSDTSSNVECTTFQGCVRAGGVIATDKASTKCIMCRPNSEYNPVSGTCECFKDFFRDNETCTSLSILCQPNELYFDGNCYVLSSQVTNTECKTNEVYNVTSRQCTCRPGLISYTTASGVRKCAAQCTNGFIFDVFVQKCTCPTNFLDMKGTCIYCQGNLSKWNPAKKQCECIPGSTMYLGECFQCGNDATYDPIDKKCKCNAGTTGNGVFCRKIVTTLPNGFTIVNTSTSNLPKNP